MAEDTAASRPLAYRGDHQVKPLPFDSTKLTGLSEKLITSHHQNNYGGAVKRLNPIEQQIGGLPKDAAPYQMGSLKREELIARNSMLLHEAYFGNLGPVLVMDMYEHSYHMDYRANAKSYVDAFFQNIHWDEVNRRLARLRAV